MKSYGHPILWCAGKNGIRKFSPKLSLSFMEMDEYATPILTKNEFVFEAAMKRMKITNLKSGFLPQKSG